VQPLPVVSCVAEIGVVVVPTENLGAELDAASILGSFTFSRFNRFALKFPRFVFGKKRP
jgi:hypothetical protein